MPPIRGKKRQLVVDRARGACEYCRLPQQHLIAGVVFPVDHVTPQNAFKPGDPACDDPENLALACQRCNGAKWGKTAALDPESQTTVDLFKPRSQVWRDHFVALPSGHIVGITVCGRATVAALQMNDHELAVENRAEFYRLGWWPAK